MINHYTYPEARFEVRDISSVSEADRLSAVKELSASSTETVFLLTRDARRKAAAVTHPVYDIDDTLTRSGIPYLPHSTVQLLEQSSSFGQTLLYLTGRHRRLVSPILRAHAQLGAEAFTELGAFRMRDADHRENFLATPEDERSLLEIRRHVQTLIDDLRREYGVMLKPNLGGDHESLDSHLVERDGVELDENDDVLLRIMARIHQSIPVPGWEVRDSSRDTFDIVPAKITKSNAMAKIIEERGLPHDQVSFADDSPNGADVHRDFPGITRAVIYGRKSRPEMLRHADIVTMGTANVDPLISFLQHSRRAG